MNFLSGHPLIAGLFGNYRVAPPPSATPSPTSTAPAGVEVGDESPTDEELAAAHAFLRAPVPADARVAMIALDEVCGGAIVRMDAALAKASAEYRANLLLDRILGGAS